MRGEAKSEAETTANSGVVWDRRGEAGDKRRANEGANRTLSLARADNATTHRWSANHTTIHIPDHIGTITLFDNMHCETWFFIKVNAIHIRVFGYVAFAHIPKKICHKFFAKSKKYVFTSYSNHYNKTYYLWDLEINKIENQDVMFMKILLEI
ncbi:unnamed protein product [Sphagnum troendelagicum]|uniref:Retroviral polymerase SH3-like domain-containing protein n=1 Tax=Sphagnum troendelagicum TaxID=128251 RepID=A0ABP0UNS7_9BRYO